eukprot:SAG31_NODE_376_length_16541_cov_4.520922_7_plen_69_part_00
MPCGDKGSKLVRDAGILTTSSPANFSDVLILVALVQQDLSAALARYFRSRDAQMPRTPVPHQGIISQH